MLEMVPGWLSKQALLSREEGCTLQLVPPSPHTLDGSASRGISLRRLSDDGTAPNGHWINCRVQELRFAGSEVTYIIHWCRVTDQRAIAAARRALIDAAAIRNASPTPGSSLTVDTGAEPKPRSGAKGLGISFHGDRLKADHIPTSSSTSMSPVEYGVDTQSDAGTPKGQGVSSSPVNPNTNGSSAPKMTVGRHPHRKAFSQRRNPRPQQTVVSSPSAMSPSAVNPLAVTTSSRPGSVGPIASPPASPPPPARLVTTSAQTTTRDHSAPVSTTTTVREDPAIMRARGLSLSSTSSQSHVSSRSSSPPAISQRPRTRTSGGSRRDTDDDMLDRPVLLRPDSRDVSDDENERNVRVADASGSELDEPNEVDSRERREGVPVDNDGTEEGGVMARRRQRGERDSVRISIPEHDDYMPISGRGSAYDHDDMVPAKKFAQSVHSMASSSRSRRQMVKLRRMIQGTGQMVPELRMLKRVGSIISVRTCAVML